MLRQPVSVVPLTNVSVVRYKSEFGRFEIACYPNKVTNWRNGIEKDIDEVLQSKEIFKSVQKGILAKPADLHKAFGKSSDYEVIQTILRDGEIQVNELERKSQQDSMLKDIATIISEKCTDKQTGRLIPFSIIMRAMEEIHISVKPNQTAKKQALKIIQKYGDKLGLERAKMRIRLTCPLEHHEKISEELKQMEIEHTNNEGSSVIIAGLIHPESYRSIYQSIQKLGLSDAIGLEVIDQTVQGNIEAKQKEMEERKEERFEQKPEPVKQKPKSGFVCNTCPNAEFADLGDHRAHFKTNWHKFNVKRKARSMESISEAEFSILTESEVQNFLLQKNV
ncbi:unnamed protein product [Blepharisma stoltei]|uniref:Ribosome maturation protein SBDS n=1 Tax=Blepharisma stoltei TaxID=1481888 RepID=A0AAU9IGF7_9CILI|nr:unnamed protein product [Blepharisma stoltei]